MSFYSQLQALVGDSKVAAPPLESEPKTKPAQPRDPAQLRAELLAQRVLPLAEYRTEFALKTSLPKVKVEGSSPNPIPVPLQPGETQREYERLFQQWLHRRNVQLSDLRADPAKERIYRFAYANQRAESISEATESKPYKPWLQGAKAPPVNQRSAPPAPSPAAQAAGSKPCELKPPARNARAADFISAYASCYCELCLRRWITLLTNRVDSLEANMLELKNVGASLEGADTGAKSGTLAESSLQSGEGEAPADGVVAQNTEVAPSVTLSIAKDPLKEQMMQQYAGFNKNVLAVESAIFDLVCRSQQSIGSDVKSALQQQAQIQQLRASICQDIENRDAVVAAFVVYCWSERQDELRSKIESSGSLDIPHLQQGIHSKCGASAAQAQGKEALLLKLKLEIHQLAAGTEGSGLKTRTDEIQKLSEQISETEAALEAQESELTGAFAQLFEFSARIRTLAKAMLESLL